MSTITRTDADGKQINVNVEVLRVGEKLILPENINPEEAAKLVTEWAKEQERIVAVNESLVGHPMDALLAFNRAMEEMFGAVIAEGRRSFFGEIPPAIMSIETGYDKKGIMNMAKVPWGIFKLIGVDGKIQLGVKLERGRYALVISGQVKAKDKDKIHKLANIARKFLANDSIYKGQAFEFVPIMVDGNNNINFDSTPRFIITTTTKPENLILPSKVEIQVQDSVFTPVLKTQACRDSNIPLKRGVLMAGTYGVGKTLTASVLAHYAVANGWTFIHVTKAEQVGAAIAQAKDLQPAIVFCEDIDRVVSGERSANMDDILNTIDGISGKNDEIMTVFTTNDLSNINGAMLRPGRIDVYIEFIPPDAAAAERLIRTYGGKLVTKSDISEAAKRLEGRIPAEIREVVNKAGLSRVTTGHKHIELEDLHRAITIMEPHFALLDRQREKDNDRGNAKPTIDKVLGALVNGMVESSEKKVMARVDEKVQEILDKM